ncbi:MAG: acetyltransferase [Candidatus Bathyarchaeota archaeon]|nr:acetyltransferase [Candidatus Bathyarchaeota archaeon]
MAGEKQKVVIIGEGETAELAYDYFKSDPCYEIVAFSAEKVHMKRQVLFSLPVVPLEQIEEYYDPKSHKAFVAISYTQLNRLRLRLCNITKQKGYSLCTYISPRAFIGAGAQIGENCFILENASIQRGAKIGDNVTIWSGSLVGHRSVVRDNCFIASHVAISGFCDIGENCFLGVNSCVGSGIKIARDCVIGAGAVVIAQTNQGMVYAGNPAKPLKNKKSQMFIAGAETI